MNGRKAKMARRDAALAETKDTTCITSANSAPLREKFCMKVMNGRKAKMARRDAELAETKDTTCITSSNSAPLREKFCMDRDQNS